MKKNKMRLSFGKGDFIVIVFVVSLAIFTGILFGKNINSEEADVVAIYKEGEKIQELPLDKNREIIVSNIYTNRIVIEEGKVSITESDCPGEDCVHSGWISGSGRSIVCLPNRVEIRIEGETEVDFIIH